MEPLEIYADGACWPNPSTSGGWGFVVYQDDEEIHCECGEAVGMTTNNKMEITAVLKALRWLADRPARIHTDSAYVVNGLNVWCKGWARSGWVRKDKISKIKGPVPNADLWKLAAAARMDCHQILWIRGHAGNAGNERADELAEIGRLGGQP